MDLQTLMALIIAHKWIPLGALIIGAIVRFLKSDSPLPTKWQIPPRWRSRFAVGLGIFGGILAAVAGGDTLQDALLQGLAAAATAISGHEIFVEGMRNGREFFTPKTPPPSAPSGDSSPLPPADKPDSPTSSFVVLALITLLTLLLPNSPMTTGCTPQDAKTAENAVVTALTLEQGACAQFQHFTTSNEPETIAVICHISDELVPAVKLLLQMWDRSQGMIAAMKADAGRSP